MIRSLNWKSNFKSEPGAYRLINFEFVLLYSHRKSCVSQLVFNESRKM